MTIVLLIVAVVALYLTIAFTVTAIGTRHTDPEMSSRMKGGAIIAAIVAVAAVIGAVG